MRKFSLEKGPYLRSVDEKIISTQRMMFDVIIALLPIVLFGWVINGILPYFKHLNNVNFFNMLQPLLNVIVGVLSSVVFEALYFLAFKKAGNIKNALIEAKNSFAAIPGLIIALILPARVDMYVIVFACFFANIIFKMLFGGLGHNIFNPALIGYAIAATVFSSQIATALEIQNGVFNSLLNITTTATPLSILSAESSSVGSFLVNKTVLVDNYGGLINLFLGLKNGALGETSGLLCLVGFVYLVARKVINWRVPVFYVGTFFIICWIIGIVNHIEGPVLGIWFPTFNILTGGLLFGSIFMATEPVTTPKSPNGKIIFAVFCAVFTALFRFIGMFNEGVCTAILFVCLFTPIIDKFAAKNRGPIISSKMVLRYLVVFVLFVLITLYTVYKTTSIPKDDLAVIEIVNTIGGGF